MATASDITIISEGLNTLGKDVCEKQKIIIKKAEQGRKFMNMLKMGTDLNIKEKDYNETIMNLLHYKQYNIHSNSNIHIIITIRKNGRILHEH